MTSRVGVRARLAAAVAIAVVDLVPLWLIVKQAVTPERESFAWPPTWWPHALTAENVHAATQAVPLGRGLALSALVAALTTLSTLALALPAAWLASHRRRIARPLDAAMVVTRLFPPIALAVPLATLFVHAGLYNHPAGLGLWAAHTLLGLPIAFLVLHTGFAHVPRDVEDAARLDGASAARAFVLVTLPLVRPALATAALLTALVSWDEFGYALLLQVTNRTLPPLLYYLAAFGHPGMASAVALLLLGPALLLLFVLEPAFRSGGLAGSAR